MVKQKAVSVFIDILRCYINGESLKKEHLDLLKSNDADFLLKNIYNLSIKHDLAHVVADYLTTNKLINTNSEVFHKFDKKLLSVYARFTTQEYETERIFSALEIAKIEFIPLKGAVLRKYYAKPWMRTSCDLDILIKKSDLSRAKDCLQSILNYSLEKVGECDVSFYNQNKSMHLELHFDLVAETEIGKAHGILSRIWDYASGEYKKTLSFDMFYFYHIAHIAKHTIEGGAGIKPYLDLAILYKSGINEEKASSLLVEGGLDVFEKQVRTLAKYWFLGGEKGEITDTFALYTIQGGAYGSIANRVKLQTGKKGSRFIYIMNRIFMPYSLLVKLYPSLQGKKFLIPFYWIKRWIDIIFSKRGKSAFKELSSSKNLDKKEIASMEEFTKKLGIKDLGVK